MQIFEILIYVFSVFLLVLYLVKKAVEPKYLLILLCATVIAFLLHIIFEETSWQVYGLYVGSLILIFIGFYKFSCKRALRAIVNKILIIASIVLIVVSGLATFVFPVYELPEPSGDYLIGTDSFIINDTSRLEIYTSDANDYRRFKIQVWYPAGTVEGYTRVPWLEDGLPVARGLAKDIGLPTFVLDHTATIMSHSYLRAPISNAKENYPVVIISHGWRGFRNLHTDFAEDLASQGYIVVGIDHTYGSVATVFGKDDVEYVNYDALPPREDTPDYWAYANRLVNTYAGDVVATLDYLESINASTSISRFSGKLDFDEIGLLGHSTGGGGDVTVALADNRIKALIGLDPWVEPIHIEDLSAGMDIPTLFLSSGQWSFGTNNDYLNILINNSSAPIYHYEIEGTTHYDFTMVYMYSPLTRLINYTGSVDGRYLNRMLETVISEFFDQQLKHISGSGGIDTTPWPEIKRLDPSFT